MPSHAVVIPAYNEAATLRDVATRALAQARRVIVVDDGSSDATAASVAGLPVTLLRNDANLGKAASLWRGMQAALTDGADAVITLDGDGQHAPEDIPRLLAAAAARPASLIIGARRGDRARIPAMRYYANRFANFWLSWASGQRLPDSQSGFRLYPAALLARLRVPHGKGRGFVFESEVLIEAARLGFPTVAVDIPAVYRPGARPSHYRHRDSLRITAMVAGKLLKRGLYPQGLYRAYLRPLFVRRSGSE
ncbi:MAG TPA: glycosyltransferase family 2 protein [Acidiferrobacterales bacterium]